MSAISKQPLSPSPSLETGSETSATLAHSTRSEVRHGRKGASYRRDDVYQLIDELKLAHVGFVIDEQVFVIPITVWRAGDDLYLHCANKGRIQRYLEAGQQLCLSFAESREWVLSKSAYHHSANYRSAVLYCRGERVADSDQFDRAFADVINQIEPGRWDKVRPPNTQERKATALMKLTIEEGSFKSRNGGPNEEPEDMALAVWHGTVPTCPFASSQDRATTCES